MLYSYSIVILWLYLLISIMSASQNNSEIVQDSSGEDLFTVHEIIYMYIY